MAGATLPVATLAVRATASSVAAGPPGSGISTGVSKGLLNIHQGFQQGYSTFSRDFNRVNQHSPGIPTGLLNIQQGFQQGYSTFNRDFNRVTGTQHSTGI
jgi:hypothetical protein